MADIIYIQRDVEGYRVTLNDVVDAPFTTLEDAYAYATVEAVMYGQGEPLPIVRVKVTGEDC